MAEFIGAVDQGTSSTRFMIFDHQGSIVAFHQKEHKQIFPNPGWVEHDPMEIWSNTKEVIAKTLQNARLSGADLAGIGITNQRETTVVWDKTTGRPFCNAIVWQCTRTEDICSELVKKGGQDIFRKKTGLPVATYFSGPKLKWILDNVPEAREGKALFGTMETWLIWLLTGGPVGGVHITDVTNASRTMLMDLKTLDWDDQILNALNIPRQILPKIVPSIDTDFWGYTSLDGPLHARVPVCAALGDQQAALVGQKCLAKGDAKNTYGTGCFLLVNTGTCPVASKHGLITTLAYQLRGRDPVYCLEGSIAMAGALVQWLRDNLGMISSSSDIEALALQAKDSAGVYIVPAFSGLFAPHWRPDARGLIIGLTRFVNKSHLARAVLEASAYQTRDIVEAMEKDSKTKLSSLKVDGGMVRNHLLMQFQSDILNVPVIRPKITETTVLGAAYAAGLASGFWLDIDEIGRNWEVDRVWNPTMTPAEREDGYRGWKKAVERTFNWAEY